jgi:hypothetical protein
MTELRSSDAGAYDDDVIVAIASPFLSPDLDKFCRPNFVDSEQTEP